MSGHTSALSARIEALLFYKAEPVSYKKLADLLSVSREELLDGLNELEKALEGRGIQLVRNDEEAFLGTSAAASELIEAIQREELSRDLGKAGLETLAIVLYKGPVTRREIDYVRGVNSAFILRNLLVRGLVERVEGEGRGYSYRPTTDLLSFMGIGSRSDLPEFAAVRAEMEKFAASDSEGSEGKEEKSDDAA
ncbi:MAG TPA: SMC-Scp complex subunit ScpB [Candidatus Paceibacterota bacterium]|jgi:segregation and condensation protein B|nr:SMC-Scp complex subunit ScpB [Candidatus Paceibacterota bacterium]